MNKWNSECKWDFPLAGSGDDVGFNEAGIGMFKSQPYLSLAKEILQNSLDARAENVPAGLPVRVKFSRIEVSVNDIPGAEQLADTIDACCEYAKGDDLEKMLQVKAYSDAHLRKDGMIPVLKISDYNTTGLVGVDDTDNNEKCWYKLVRSNSSTNKSNGSSGSQGVGKFAAYNFTRLRTILYSTLTEDGARGIQGKTILTTFRAPEDGKKRVNRARFGMPVADEDVLPISNEEEIPTVFHRSDIGTDIFVIGFEKDQDWLEQIAMSVIEFFFFAVYKGTLEVDLEDGEEKIHIGSDNLNEMIAKYEDYYKSSGYEDDENFQYTAPLYWKAVTDLSGEDEGHYHIIEDFTYRGKSMGQFELYLLMSSEFNDRRILEMRKAGMKIREDTKFRIQPSFIGVFIATGDGAVSLEPNDNISSFLRKCENPSHDAWSAANYPEEKGKAKSIINSIHKRILEIIKEKMPKNDEPEIKAYGVNELLVSQGQGDAEDEKEDAFLNADPEPIELLDSTSAGTKSRDLSKKSNGRGKNTRNKKKKKDNDNERQKRNNRSGHRKKSVSPVTLKSVKMPFDEDSGIYKVVFTTDTDATNLRLALEATGDDGSHESADITDAFLNGKPLEIKEDCVIVPSVTADEKNIVEVKLRGSRRERLEASAYGEL
jgi:hypothetical protein